MDSTGKKNVMRVLGWVLGILALIAGIFGFGSGVGYAILTIIIGLLLLPPVHDMIAKNMGEKMAYWPKWIVIVVLAIVASMIQQ